MYKPSRIKCFIFFVVFFVPAAVILAQRPLNKDDLQRKKEQLRKDIDFTNKLLDVTRQKRESSMGQLLTLGKQIDMRKELIYTINGEITNISIQIAQLSIQIDSLQKDLAKLKADYAKMIVFAQRNQGLYKRLMFIFASSDFNQAYKRIKYLQQYAVFRQKQAEMIVKKQKEVAAKLQELNNKRLSKKGLLDNEQHEQKTLEVKKTEQWGIISNLQEKEKLLRKQLAEKQKTEERINKAIEDIIRKEIEAARKKALAAGKKNITKSNAVISVATPSEVKLSGDFEANRGRLPWPVDQGVITGTFGVHPHPVLKGIMINNNGVDITASRGAMAKSVYEGLVTGVISIPGANKAVIVSHGDYRSVYCNLDDANVRVGDKVSMHQVIGRIHTDEDEAKAVLNLQIWKGGIRVDPSDWLSSRR